MHGRGNPEMPVFGGGLPKPGSRQRPPRRCPGGQQPSPSRSTPLLAKVLANDRERDNSSTARKLTTCDFVGAGARIRTENLSLTRRLLCLLSHTGGAAQHATCHPTTEVSEGVRSQRPASSDSRSEDEPPRQECLSDRVNGGAVPQTPSRETRTELGQLGNGARQHFTSGGGRPRTTPLPPRQTR